MFLQCRTGVRLGRYALESDLGRHLLANDVRGVYNPYVGQNFTLQIRGVGLMPDAVAAAIDALDAVDAPLDRGGVGRLDLTDDRPHSQGGQRGGDPGIITSPDDRTQEA